MLDLRFVHLVALASLRQEEIVCDQLQSLIFKYSQVKPQTIDMILAQCKQCHAQLDPFVNTAQDT